MTISVAFYALGALSCVILANRPAIGRLLGYGFAAIAGIAGLIGSLGVLAGSPIPPVEVFRAAPFLPVVVAVDPLAAWFILVLSLVGGAVSIAALDYARAYDHHDGSRLGAFYNLFLGAMLAVLAVQSVFGFMIAWETMSLVSYVLVVHDHDERSVRRAGFVYLVMTHVGSAFLFAAFFALARAGGGLDFAALRAGARALDSTSRDLVFLAALIGFGTKAGVIPLHVWLPRAHPVAPSHVSALMSGVMLKVAIYGIARMTFDLLGGGPAWWGGLILAAGVVSAVLGVLYALMQHDLKRLLAYHSVENVGIILMGLGSALLLSAASEPTLAALALAAGLFHTLNHALFKALLFLGAGAIDQSTGTKNLEQMGGLIRRMPQTAVLFLVGAAAISAIPPLNGFASEWLTFQALLGVGIHGSGALTALGATVAAGLLALTGALAAACFVKAFGVAFLALPRSVNAAKAAEAPLALRIGMALLAFACILLGLQPGRALDWLAPVTATFYGVAPRSTQVGDILAPSGANLAPIGVLGALIALGALPLLAFRLLGTPPSRRGPTWVCGWNLTPRMEYGSTAFAKPIRLFFRAILQPERDVEYGYAQAPYFVNRIRYEASIRPVIEQHLYGTVTSGLLRIANAIRFLQNGSMRLYLAYVLATLIIILLVAAR